MFGGLPADDAANPEVWSSAADAKNPEVWASASDAEHPEVRASAADAENPEVRDGRSANADAPEVPVSIGNPAMDSVAGADETVKGWFVSEVGAGLGESGSDGIDRRVDANTLLHPLLADLISDPTADAVGEVPPGGRSESDAIVCSIKRQVCSLDYQIQIETIGSPPWRS